jgi:hypothetical protein
MQGSKAKQFKAALAMLAAGLWAGAVLQAHDVTYRGTVVSVEASRLQVKTIDAKTKKDTLLWVNIAKQTKTRRGEKLVPYPEARIAIDERVVVVIAHDAEKNMIASEIRLAAR